MTAKNVDFKLNQAIGFSVNRTAFLMSEEITVRFKRDGYPITAQDFGILNMLWQQEGITQVEIARKMMRDKTTITRRLDSLVNKGLIERCVTAEDRRVYLIYLTKEGKAAMAVLIKMVSEFQKEMLQGISAEERDITLRTLRKMTEKLSRRA